VEIKKSYRLKDSEITPSGNLRQVYIYKTNDPASETDEVIDLIWGRDM
jgi:hypothetical protein